MASTNFTYSPTTGVGNTNVSVCAVTTNQSQTGADNSATLTFSNGQNSKNVSIIQRYKPILNQGPTSVPASGGTLYGSGFDIKTEYDVVFANIPSWVNGITMNGSAITINNGTSARIAAADASGGTLNINVSANNTSSPRSAGSNWNKDGTLIPGEGMCMYHYIGNSLNTTNPPYVQIHQDCDTSGINTDVDSLTFDWNASVAKTIQVQTGGNWTSSIADN